MEITAIKLASPLAQNQSVPRPAISPAKPYYCSAT